MAFSPTDIVSRAPVLSAQLDQEHILLDVEASKYLQLNATASEIWSALADPVSVGDLSARLRARFDAPAGAIDKDVIAFLETLRSRGMLVCTPTR